VGLRKLDYLLIGWCWGPYISHIPELLEQGANVNANIGGSTPLLTAVSKNRLETVSLLVKRGADVNQPDSKGVTPLMLAGFNGNLDIVSVLLSGGARVNARHGDRAPALIWAADNGHTRVAKLLLKNGANVNAGDAFGNTALSIATEEGHLGLLRILRLAGAKRDNASSAKSRSVFPVQGGLPTLSKRR